MFNKSSIKAKSVFVLAFILVGFTFNTVVNEISFKKIRTSYERFHDVGYTLSLWTSRLHVNAYKLRGDVYKLLAMPGESEAVSADIRKDLANIDTAMAVLVGLEGVADDSTSEAIAKLQKLSIGYVAAVNEIMEKALAGDVEFGKESMKSGKAHDARKIFDAAFKDLQSISASTVTGIDEEIIRTIATTMSLAFGVAILVLFLTLAAGMALMKQITRPLQALSKDLDLIGEGDCRPSKTDWSGYPSEIAQMASSIDRMRTMLHEALGAVNTTAMAGVESSESQTDMTRKLDHEAATNEKEAQSSAAAAEEASSTIKGITRSANNSMSRLESVSAAIEEMSASVSEIAGGAERTREMTNSALDGARIASARMDELSTASKEIRQVVEMIVEISEQTKLLALNATIEAARAGEAGKGFAVVAGEVKELAKGAAEATDEIRKRVEAIQVSAGNAVAEIEKVTGNMTTLGQNITTIASAVEEQSATTREIARSVSDAVQETRDIQRSMDAGSSAVDLIAQDIQSILERGRALRAIAATSKKLAEDSAEHADTLSREIARFKL